MRASVPSRLLCSAATLLCLPAATAAQPPGGRLAVTTRSQRPQTTGRHRWEITEQQGQWDARRTAFVVVDMWNDHPCLSATFRIHGLAGPMEQVLTAVRLLPPTPPRPPPRPSAAAPVPCVACRVARRA